MKDEYKTVIRHLPDGTIEDVCFQHMILNVGLKEGNDEHFVIDLAGAQFHQYRAATPQAAYMTKWVMSANKGNPFGYNNRRFKNAARNQNDPDMLGADMRAMIIHQDLSSVVNTAATELEAKAGMTLAKMLNQKEDVFEADKAVLVQAINRDMRGYLDWFKAKPQKFRFETVKKEDLPKWEEEKAGQRLEFGPDVPQDVKDFTEEQFRKGTQIINFSDL